MIKFVVLIFALLFAEASVCAPASYDDYKDASIIIGKWFSKSTSHYDFLSATPLTIKRSGKKFMITGSAPATQTSSDYGLSYMQVPRDDSVTKAYETIGADTSNMNDTLNMTRFHMNLGIGHISDYTFSYMTTQDVTFSGWGVGYKRVLEQWGPVFFSYRIQYSRSEKQDFFTHDSLTNDFSISLYLRLIDLYSGIRHTSGRINFNSSMPELQLPEVKYISDFNELEYFYGLILSTSTNSRLALQMNKVGEEYSLGIKFSLRFESLLPSGAGWFRDPRHLKQ